ncbi:MAG: DNA-directed RNA polymerase subunit beta', partial [Thermomicrobiaceae bacterium]|nr:DNA-directed RNA polymerase subunit beta' [Thermomicrobiaceae bacterium]
EMTDVESFTGRIVGRVAASPVVDPSTGEEIVARNEEISEAIAAELVQRGIRRVFIRTPIRCESEHGVCSLCYGRNLASGHLVELGEAVGIIAAQSIGEPGTQLTMRTFHTGGITGVQDITTGLPRVEELFEAREPKGKAVITEVEGTVRIVEDEQGRRIVVTPDEVMPDVQRLPEGYQVEFANGDTVVRGQVLAAPVEGPGEPVVARMDGVAFIEGDDVIVRPKAAEPVEYTVPAAAHIRVEDGQHVPVGTQLTDGSLDPQEVLETLGPDAVARYIIDEVQKVYKSQGVVTNDKHIEVIVRQMLRRVMVEHPGDTDLLVGESVDRFEFNRINADIIAQGGEPALAHQMLLGITKASIQTDSFLSAASFQETTRVLTEAAINGKVDYLRGLKENVIIGKLIPAGSGFYARQHRE